MFNKLNIFKTIYKMETQQINNVVVKPVPIEKKHQSVKGSDLFINCYSNIFLLGKKHSGKSSVIWSIVRKCIDKNTKVIIFCSTLFKDDTYICIRKYLESKKIEFEYYTSIVDGKSNILNELILDMQGDISDDNKSSSEDEPEIVQFSNGRKYKKRKPKPVKVLAPKYLIIFDDISGELSKNPAVNVLLKQNRHYKCKTVISSQYIHDLTPMARKNLDNWLVFPGINTDKLERLYLDADVNLTMQKFLELYNNACAEKYNFLYIDVNKPEYRKNFNQKYLI